MLLDLGMKPEWTVGDKSKTVEAEISRIQTEKREFAARLRDQNIATVERYEKRARRQRQAAADKARRERVMNQYRQQVLGEMTSNISNKLRNYARQSQANSPYARRQELNRAITKSVRAGNSGASDTGDFVLRRETRATSSVTSTTTQQPARSAPAPASAPPASKPKVKCNASGAGSCAICISC
jgi:hypothetical protein